MSLPEDWLSFYLFASKGSKSPDQRLNLWDCKDSMLSNTILSNYKVRTSSSVEYPSCTIPKKAKSHRRTNRNPFGRRHVVNNEERPTIISSHKNASRHPQPPSPTPRSDAAAKKPIEKTSSHPSSSSQPKDKTRAIRSSLLKTTNSSLKVHANSKSISKETTAPAKRKDAKAQAQAQAQAQEEMASSVSKRGEEEEEGKVDGEEKKDDEEPEKTRSPQKRGSPHCQHKEEEKAEEGESGQLSSRREETGDERVQHNTEEQEASPKDVVKDQEGEKRLRGALDVEEDSDRRPHVIEVAPSSGGTRDMRRYLADSVDVGFAGESSPRPGPYRRPGKEPLASVDEVDGANESSPGPGGGAGEGSLKEMSSNDIHQDFQACQAQGASLELALFRRLEHMLVVERSTREEAERRAAVLEVELAETKRLLGCYQTISSRQSKTI
ncbi:uncharacterized protein A4U43_C05F35030 [Asparagus officinalis]|uniref:Uncharacterized protein n=1 Tax=Asparagus officinalis TaxID=4686 RepID=A0A5P1EWZ8_ASPOF|nr:uncharacterized protein A4U43_C05F35030 [Asparagus officinalis]